MPDPVSTNCQNARKVLTAFRAVSHDESILRMALDGMIEIDEGCLGNSKAENAARHVESCAACTAWLDEFYPNRAASRAAREQREQIYCCTSMSFAVRDKEAQTRFSFVMFRGEDPCWRINDDYSFARFCPWCGQHLPDGPFQDGAQTE